MQKTRKTHWIAAPVFLIVGILIGRIDKSPEASAHAREDTVSPTRERRTDNWTKLRSPSYGTLRAEIRNAPSDEMPGVLKRALTHPDQFERRKLILECFQGMDSNNWRDMFLKFSEVTKETGMTHRDEWEMALMLAGQHGGREAAEWFHETAGGDQLREAVWGWSQVDPITALAWVDEISKQDPDLKNRLNPVVVGGAIQRDGLAALKMLDAMEPAARMACVGDTAWNLVQRDGMDSAVEWAVQTTEQYGASETDYAQRVVNDVVGRIFNSSKEFSSGRDAAARMARVIAADPAQNHRVGMFVSGLPKGQPLEFLSELANRPVADQESMQDLIHSQLNGFVRSRPNDTAQWVEDHPDDPLAETVRGLLR